MAYSTLGRQLVDMLDAAAADLQAVIQPPPQNLAKVPTGYLALLYPYDADKIAAAVINTPLETLPDVQRLEDFLIAMHRMLTMTSDLNLDSSYDHNDAVRWSQVLQVHIRGSIAADTTTHLWSTNRFGDAIYTLDTQHREAQLIHLFEDDDFPDKLAVLAHDLQEFVRTYRNFVTPTLGTPAHG